MLLRFKATPNNEPAQTICCLGKVSKKYFNEIRASGQA